MTKKVKIILLIIVGVGVFSLLGIFLLPAAILCGSGPKFINEGYDTELKTKEIHIDTMCIFRRRIHLTKDIEGDAFHSSAKWSPDRERIVFEAIDDEESGESNIFVINANGEGLIQLTNKQGYNSYPDWSPDGTKIAFQSDRDGNEEIYIMDSDGSNQVNLTKHEELDQYPDWAPEGVQTAFREKPEDDYITFSSARDGNFEIYVMNVTDGTLLNLTNNPQRSDLGGKWLEDGRIQYWSSDYPNIIINIDGTQEIIK